MRYLMFIILTLVCTTASAADWTPPKEPDPLAILEEAHVDTESERYEIALAKYVWFHENALSIRPSASGVRLSFALMYWHLLAKKYPPALIKLKDIRDQASKNVFAGINVPSAFNEMASINVYLEEQSSTMNAFEFLDEKNPEAAKAVFDLAQPSLVQGKAFVLVGKYVSPDTDYEKMRQRLERSKKIAEKNRDQNDGFAKRHLFLSTKMFVNDTTILVAILAVNDRKEEALKIATAARTEWDDNSFHEALDRALKGVVPTPWP